MELSLVPDRDDLSFYLNYLYEGLDGFVCVATKHPTERDDKGRLVFKRESFEWPSKSQALYDWIIAESSAKEVYIAPVVFSEPSGRKEFFKATNVLWADFDGSVPEHNGLGSIPPATLQIRSSGERNLHWYWRLETPLTDASKVEGINRSLTYQLGADASGWDIGQVLRPPSTYNHKRDKKVYLLSHTESRVSPVHFDVLPPVEPVEVLLPEVIPDITDVVLKYPWPKDVADLYKSKTAPGEERSDKLMHLGYMLAEMGMSDAEIYSVVRNADDRWGKFKDRTDREQRLSDLIARVRLKHPVEIVVSEDLIPIFGLQSFLNTEIEIEWVIPGLLQEQGYMLLVGPAGVGKTQYSLRWAINLALGRPFLGHEIVAAQRILFWSLEMGHADLKYFLSTMCKEMTKEELLLLEQNLLIIPLGEALYFDDPKVQQQVESIIKDFNPTGMMVDSVGSSTSGNVSDEGTVKKLMDFNDRVRQRHNVFTWYIHHQRKAQGDNKKPNKLDDVYGNQYLYNRATSVYLLWPAGSSIEVKPLKKRLAAMEDPWLITRSPSNLDFKKGGTVTIKGSAPKVNLEDEDGDTPGMVGF